MFGGFARQTELGREADRLPRRRGDLQGIVLRHEGDLLPHVDVGRVDSVVVQANVGFDLQPAFCWDKNEQRQKDEIC